MSTVIVSALQRYVLVERPLKTFLVSLFLQPMPKLVLLLLCTRCLVPWYNLYGRQMHRCNVVRMRHAVSTLKSVGCALCANVQHATPGKNSMMTVVSQQYQVYIKTAYPMFSFVWLFDVERLLRRDRCGSARLLKASSLMMQPPPAKRRATKRE